MSWAGNVLEEMKRPFNTLVVLSFLVTILYFVIPHRWVLPTAFLLTILTLLGLAVTVRVTDWFRDRPGVKVYFDWNAAPSRYGIERTLSYAAKKKAKLEIVGRTCFRWLCGHERRFGETDDSSWQDEPRELLHKLISRTIESGGEIRFVLQNPNIPIEEFDKNQQKQLRRHCDAAVESFSKVLSSLRGDEARKRLTLWFVNEPVVNSMVRLTTNGKVKRFVVDLRVKFLAAKAHEKEESVSMPILIFTSGGLKYCREYMEDFDYACDEAQSKKQFEDTVAVARNKVCSLNAEYELHSALRQDRASELGMTLAKHSLAARDPDMCGIPPTCIHLIVTNNCHTHCAMCDHYKLYGQSKGSELGTPELRSVLSYIKKMGCDAVIISGGEPLMRDDLLNVLEHGASIGLKLALFTSGIGKHGKSIGRNAAQSITQYCEWVQVSVDSFNPETYRIIRKAELDQSLQTIRYLVDSSGGGATHVEVVFTIQNHNLAEVGNLASSAQAALPPSVPIRLKFAHGPEAKRDFLCSTEELGNAVREWPASHERINFRYILHMIQQRYFTLDDIAQGTPLLTFELLM